MAYLTSDKTNVQKTITEILHSLKVGQWILFNHDIYHHDTKYAQVIAVRHTATDIEFDYQYITEPTARTYYDNNVDGISIVDEKNYYSELKIKVVEHREVISHIECLLAHVKGATTVK